MSTKTAHKLNLTQCLEIQANQYRSKHNDTDYYPELIDGRIIELQSLKAQRDNKKSVTIYNELIEHLDAQLIADDTYKTIDTDCDCWLVRKSDNDFELLTIPSVIIPF